MTVQFSPPDISELEIERVAEVLRSGWITTGPKVKEFERKIAAFCGVNRAVCLNSQTACAELALRLLDVGPGDEVLLPRILIPLPRPSSVTSGEARARRHQSTPGNGYEKLEKCN